MRCRGAEEKMIFFSRNFFIFSNFFLSIDFGMYLLTLFLSIEFWMFLSDLFLPIDSSANGEFEVLTIASGFICASMTVLSRLD